MCGMPWLLLRYILGELLRVFAIAAAVLVMVTAFGAAIKPLAAEDLIGPLQTGKYILLALVPMLQFALPFAAGFAATLVLHRLTTDNEIQAAAVSGISYGRLLFPIAALGSALLVVMVLLTQSVIPRFWALMDRHLAADVSRAVLASIEKGIPFHVGRYQIYGDRGRVVDRPPDTNAETRLVLHRVALAAQDQTGRIVADGTARYAVVDVHRHEGRTYLKLVMSDTVVFNDGQLYHSPEIKPKAVPVPGSLMDDPMFMTQTELLDLHEHPEHFGPVGEAKELLAASLQQADAWREVDRQLRGTGVVELRGDSGTYTVRAEQLADRSFKTSDGRSVEVSWTEPGNPGRLVRAASAAIRPAADYRLDRPAFDLLLKGCEIVDLGSGAVNHRELHREANLEIADLQALDRSGLTSRELLEEAVQLEHPAVKAQAGLLSQRTRELRLEIRARLLNRYAMSLTALLLPVLGAALAMWLRDSLPLVIYVWAFVPSILDVLLISGGDHMIRQGQVVAGSVVMWSGNAVLLAASVFAVARLMRH